MITAEDKLLIAKVNDLFSLCQKHCEEKFSAFLDGGELAVISDNVHFPYGLNIMIWGGYEDAQRKMIGVFPEWVEPSGDLFPIKTFLIKNNGTKKLSHRDYLGTIMSLEIDRSKIGDIVINDDSDAYLFVAADIARYVADNITKVSNSGVSVTEVDPSEAQLIKPKLQKMSAVCASMRLDAVVGAACSVSRQEAAKLISGAKVKVNHRIIESGSKQVNEGDMLSVRGYGRFIVSSVGELTRKGRLHITISKFI